MSKWIDADAIKNKAWKAESEACFYALEDVVSVTDIDEAPSIDVIRCGECKYWKSTVQMPNGTEVKCLYGRKADDFCSYGSRSEKPNNCETCKFELYCPEMCEGCCEWDSHYEPKDEPQTDKGIGGCSRCEGRFDCYDRDMPHAVRCNNYGKVTDEKE